MMWFLLAACNGPEAVLGTLPDASTETSDTSKTRTDTGPSDTDTDTALTDTGALEAVREAVHQAGFAVGNGALVFSTMEGCCDPGANCWGNNPSTPYGAYAVPPAPGQPVRADTLLKDFGPVPPGLSRDFLLRQDEAIVWLGTMPPKAKYFGFRSSLAVRPGVSNAIVGSLGAATNHLTVQAARGSQAWEQPVAVVTSADAAVEARVIDALVAGGWDPSHIVTDRMAPVVNLGLNEAIHDSLFTTMRVAVYDDPAAGALWQQNPGTVWRLTPTTLSQPERHPMPDLLERGTGGTEQAWAEARLALETALLARFADGASQVQPIIPYWRETLECIDSDYSCNGDIRDRFVGVSPYFALPTGADFLVSWGVNHELTGKASYASVSVQTIDKQRGIESVDSRAMVGSARPYLDHPLVDDLFVVVFARDCSPFDGVCVEVPWTCPGGSAEELLKITGRAYLEPTTGAAPVPEELEGDSVLLVWPR